AINIFSANKTTGKNNIKQMSIYSFFYHAPNQLNKRKIYFSLFQHKKTKSINKDTFSTKAQQQHITYCFL
ncbi:hypothetical protein, partial [Escherichia coli]|uniref:hypothetical protein n=1 Tax=Escherichia coli TaxID=562 RepID=UPI003EE833CB